MLPGPQCSPFSGAVLVNIRAPELSTGLLTGPSLAYALPGNNLLQFIRKHWKARHVWSKPDSRIPFMQKATYTQAADSLKGFKHNKGDHLSNATT